jgi:hypothetical protein
VQVASHKISSRARFVGDNDTAIFSAQLRKYHCQREIHVQDGLPRRSILHVGCQGFALGNILDFQKLSNFPVKILDCTIFFVHEPIEVKF